MLSKLSSSINPDQTASFSPNKLCSSYKISCIVKRLKFCYTLKSSIWHINLTYKSFWQSHSTALISLLLWMNLHKISHPSLQTQFTWKFPSQMRGIIIHDFPWGFITPYHLIYLTLLLPSGLQARAVTSFPVFSFGGKLHTRWKFASRWSKTYKANALKTNLNHILPLIKVCKSVKDAQSFF